MRNIDFEKALETFKRITSQFNKEGDVALFFMEKRLINQGDLFLQKLKNDVASETYNIHRQSFNSHRVIYTSGNLEGVIQRIAEKFNINKKNMGGSPYRKTTLLTKKNKGEAFTEKQP